MANPNETDKHAVESEP